jgi:hypothetical protein
MSTHINLFLFRDSIVPKSSSVYFLSFTKRKLNNSFKSYILINPFIFHTVSEGKVIYTARIIILCARDIAFVNGDSFEIF